MESAATLASSLAVEGRGIFLLSWLEKAELEKSLRIVLTMLAETPWQDFLVPATLDLPNPVLTVLEQRQSEEVPTPGHPLLLLFLDQTAGRVASPGLNGWRRALARAPGSLLVLKHNEAGEFCKGAPDLCSLVTTHRACADMLLASWDDNANDVLRRAWLLGARQPRMPEALSLLPGEPLDEEEFSTWLSYHLDQATPALE